MCGSIIVLLIACIVIVTIPCSRWLLQTGIQRYNYLLRKVAQDRREHRDFFPTWLEGWKQAATAKEQTAKKKRVELGSNEAGANWSLEEDEEAALTDEVNTKKVEVIYQHVAAKKATIINESSGSDDSENGSDVSESRSAQASKNGTNEDANETQEKEQEEDDQEREQEDEQDEEQEQEADKDEDEEAGDEDHGEEEEKDEGEEDKGEEDKGEEEGEEEEVDEEEADEEVAGETDGNDNDNDDDKAQDDSKSKDNKEEEASNASLKQDPGIKKGSNGDVGSNDDNNNDCAYQDGMGSQYNKLFVE